MEPLFVVGDCEERDDDDESVRAAQEILCSPFRTGPAILEHKCNSTQGHERGEAYVPSIPEEPAALVHAKYKVHFLGSSICLIKNTFIVLLRRPQIFPHAQIQIRLREHEPEEPDFLSHRARTWVNDLRIK
jgi:hypothetical protein